MSLPIPCAPAGAFSPGCSRFASLLGLEGNLLGYLGLACEALGRRKESNLLAISQVLTHRPCLWLSQGLRLKVCQDFEWLPGGGIEPPTSPSNHFQRQTWHNRFQCPAGTHIPPFPGIRRSFPAVSLSNSDKSVSHRPALLNAVIEVKQLSPTFSPANPRRWRSSWT